MDVVKIFDTSPLRMGNNPRGSVWLPEEKPGHSPTTGPFKGRCDRGRFPIASNGDFQSVKLIAEKVRDVEIAGLARCNVKDIDRTWEALQGGENPRIHVFMPHPQSI